MLGIFLGDFGRIGGACVGDDSGVSYVGIWYRNYLVIDLKSYGIPGRARLFEVVQKVKEVNAARLRAAIQNHTAVYKNGKPPLSSPSYWYVHITSECRKFQAI